MTATFFAARSASRRRRDRFLGLRRRLTWRSQVKAQSAGRSHKPRNLAKSVTVE